MTGPKEELGEEMLEYKISVPEQRELTHGKAILKYDYIVVRLSCMLVFFQ